MGVIHAYIRLLEKNDMLELTQKTLREVSFDAALFQKELNKALKWLTDKDEINALRKWCFREFGTYYKEILETAFN